MEKNRARQRFYILGLYVCLAAISLVHCDARKSVHSFTTQKHSRSSSIKFTRKMHDLKRFDTGKGNSFFEPIFKQLVMPLDASNNDSYISSPTSMPPYDSLAPIPLPDGSPPYCLYPPSTPQAPSTIPSPTGGYTPLPPPASSGPTLPGPSPPEGSLPSPPYNVPTPTQPGLSPPYNVPTPTQPGLSPPYNVPTPTQPGLSPPYFTPNPPVNVPSPSGGYVPSPHSFLPPIVYPPPAVPPPPHTASGTSLWCVAKPSVPDPIIQEAMNYACGSGADCDQIQPSGSCFQPNTLFAHASYAFNSYWQRTKVAGGTCEFGGTAMLVTVDPSYDGCHFVYF
ncbi:leucine-rich repeat extensin-like protein 3 [Olea europaea var. sylvestris]|uniref:leucine-rich repeat extensin-like protein 3 n=1 Tax=Olea europaea var. sylvestris TaxID=158386 RepID=UPI000C1CEE78|nr:leucine-rich repeat extensin-like protein 3 [Olea europaea var. sylvestris]